MFLSDIPDYWSPDQALAIYELLADLQERIWDKYDLNPASKNAITSIT